MVAEFKGTVWSGHKGTVWKQQGLAPGSMLTSLQITLINDNSEWKRPFARAMLWENGAGSSPGLNVAFMSQGHRLPSQAANGNFFFCCGRTLDLTLDVTSGGTPRGCHFSCCGNAEAGGKEKKKNFHLCDGRNEILMCYCKKKKVKKKDKDKNKQTWITQGALRTLPLNVSKMKVRLKDCRVTHVDLFGRTLSLSFFWGG